MVPWRGGGGSSQGTRPQQTKIEENIYDVAYKQYVKEKGVFSSYISLGAQIGQGVENHDKNSKETENNDNKYYKNIKK